MTHCTLRQSRHSRKLKRWHINNSQFDHFTKATARYQNLNLTMPKLSISVPVILGIANENFSVHHSNLVWKHATTVLLIFMFHCTTWWPQMKYASAPFTLIYKMVFIMRYKYTWKNGRTMAEDRYNSSISSHWADMYQLLDRFCPMLGQPSNTPPVSGLSLAANIKCEVALWFSAFKKIETLKC